MGKRRNVVQLTENADISIAVGLNTIQSRRTAPKTKAHYKNSLRIFKSWLQLKYPEALLGDEIIVPLPTGCFMMFLDTVALPARMRVPLNGPEDLTAETSLSPYSVEYLNSFRNAVVDMYKNSNTKLTEAENIEIKGFIKGYEKTLNDLKKKNLMTNKKGKRHIRFDSYKIIAFKLMTLHGQGVNKSFASSTFAWCFFVLLWNLIGRPEVLKDLTNNRISWKQDCLNVNDQVR
jgi:hypothetical protein